MVIIQHKYLISVTRIKEYIISFSSLEKIDKSIKKMTKIEKKKKKKSSVGNTESLSEKKIVANKFVY